MMRKAWLVPSTKCCASFGLISALSKAADVIWMAQADKFLVVILCPKVGYTSKWSLSIASVCVTRNSFRYARRTQSELKVTYLLPIYHIFSSYCALRQKSLQTPYYFYITLGRRHFFSDSDIAQRLLEVSVSQSTVASTFVKLTTVRVLLPSVTINF